MQNSAMPLPFPAPNLSPAPIPADRLPRPCKPEGAFAPNTALRLARRLFEGQIVGSGGALPGPSRIVILCFSLGPVYTATQPNAA
jgi:hypothetical protein